MRRRDVGPLRLFACIFSALVILPGIWIALVLLVELPSDWLKLPANLYFLLPALPAVMLTQAGQEHFTLFMPGPLTRTGYVLTFLFYTVLSLGLTHLIARVRRRAND